MMGGDLEGKVNNVKIFLVSKQYINLYNENMKHYENLARIWIFQ